MPTTDGFFVLIECLKLNLSIERISKSKSLDVSLPILIHFDQALCANDVLMATVAALYKKTKLPNGGMKRPYCGNVTLDSIHEDDVSISKSQNYVNLPDQPTREQP